MSTPPLASMPPLSLLTPFAVAFTAPTFRHVLVLVSGTILASGRRTMAAALRAVGLGDAPPPHAQVIQMAISLSL